jgi:hypothetical protein
MLSSPGGNSPGTNSHALPDFVDSTVASWIAAQTATMNDAWGPAKNRGALAFVHIPPCALVCISLTLFLIPDFPSRHAVQALQQGLDPAKNPGLNGLSLLSFLLSLADFEFSGHTL